MRWLILPLLILAAQPLPAAQSELDALLHQLKQERRAEQAHHLEREARFLERRDERKQLLEQARAAKKAAEARAAELRRRFQANEERLQALDTQLQQATGELGELFDAARQQAADARVRQHDSLVAAQYPEHHAALDALADDDRLPTIDQLEDLWLSLLEEINRSGRVSRFESPVIGPDGSESIRPVLRVGSFQAIADGRFLRYLPETGRFVEPARQPPFRALESAARFEAATSGFHQLAVDPSRGALLGALGRTPTVMERIRQGGPVGYVILGLGAFALLLVLERFLVLGWIQLRMGRQAGRDQADSRNPLGRLSLLADRHAEASLEALDMHLDEAAAREAGRLTRGLTSLGVVAAMAPLLGLLGTVTGMIETFQTITLFGSGDPKLMSSGISQALVTTQLGLAVAVPVLLLHSFLKGRANRMIERLDGHVALLLGSRA